MVFHEVEVSYLSSHLDEALNHFFYSECKILNPKASEQKSQKVITWWIGKISPEGLRRVLVDFRSLSQGTKSSVIIPELD